MGVESNSDIVIAVADGVGSAEFSGLGADTACVAAANALREHGPAIDVGQLGAIVAGEIEEQARQFASSPSSFSTTLVVGYLNKDEPGATVTLFAIGDSGASLFHDRALSRVDFGSFPTQQCEFHETCTEALPGSPGSLVKRTLNLASGDGVVLWTDGFEPLLEFRDSRRYIESMLTDRPIPSASDILWFMDARVRSYDDDRTAVFVLFK